MKRKPTPVCNHITISISGSLKGSLHNSNKICGVMVFAFMVVSLSLLMTMISPAYASGIGPTEGSCGENATWLYSDGTLTISGTGPMEDYQYNTQPWKNWRTSIKTLVVDDGITTIGNYALYYAETLTSVQLPSSITNIGNEAFYGCRSLKSIVLPNKLASIGKNAFSSSGLTSITIPDSVTMIDSGAFGWCSSLTKATLPVGITALPLQLFNNTSLREVNIPDGVTSIARAAFNNCELTTIALPDSVTTIDEGAFSGCSKMTDVYFLGDINIAYQIDIGSNNGYLTGAAWHFEYDNDYLLLPPSLLSIEAEAFLNVASTHIVIPQSVIYIDAAAFSSSNVTLYGFEGSYAHKWAQDNQCVFVPINDTWLQGFNK